MTNVQRPHGLAEEIADLKKRIQILERTSRLNSASIGSGGLLVRDGGSVTIESPGDLLLKDEDGDIVWRASSDAIQIDGGYESRDGTTVPPDWDTYAGSAIGVEIDVPENFARMQFLLMVSAGQTFSGDGNISVAPRIQYIGGVNNGNVYNGPAIATPNNGIAVAQSFWSRTWSLGGARSIRFGVQATSNGTTVAGQGNWHSAVSVIFKRQ